jgi:alkylated DNA repair dioxygenase AlkB
MLPWAPPARAEAERRNGISPRYRLVNGPLPEVSDATESEHMFLQTSVRWTYGGGMPAVLAPQTRTLFGHGMPQPDRCFGALQRHHLDAVSWIDHQSGWLDGSEYLLEVLLDRVRWLQYRRPMYDRMVDEPRLTVAYPPGSAWPHEVLGDLSALLSARYGQQLGSLSLNLYRNGSDSVAWHGDRLGPNLLEPVVAIVSLGAPRPFLVRPRGGGRSRSFPAGWGDLLVMGGRCQQHFEHAVPKVARAGPRVSVMFRPYLDETWAQRIGAQITPAGRWSRP